MHDALPPFLLIFDLDGVLYRGTDPIPEAAPALAALRAAEFQIAFLTNNAWATPDEVAAKLGTFGIAATAAEVTTSAQTTAATIARSHPGARVLAVGGPGLIGALELAGLIVTTAADPESPIDVVAVGIDWNFTYNTLARAQHALLQGAAFYCTNRDPRYPCENGRFRPGAGSLVAAIEAASGRPATLVGKPAPTGIEMILEQYGRAPKETLVIGDQLATDILAGNLAGCRTCLITTGVSSPDEAEAARGIQRPTWVHASLHALAEELIAEQAMVVRG